MARSGLNKSEVRKARDFLVSQGRHPSVDAIRAALGNTGSKTTIHKYLKELEKEAGKTSDRQAEITGTLHDFVEQLAAKLHADAEARIQAMQAAHELVLQRNAEEAEALRKRIDMLTDKLREAEAATRQAKNASTKGSRQKSVKQSAPGVFGSFFNTGRNSAQKSAKQSDSGFFSSFLNTGRNGLQEQSLFSVLLNAGTS